MQLRFNFLPSYVQDSFENNPYQIIYTPSIFENSAQGMQDLETEIRTHGQRRDSDFRTHISRTIQLQKTTNKALEE